MGIDFIDVKPETCTQCGNEIDSNITYRFLYKDPGTNMIRLLCQTCESSFVATNPGLGNRFTTVSC